MCDNSLEADEPPPPHPLPPKFLTQLVWVGAQEVAFLACSQVILMLMGEGPSVEDHRPRVHYGKIIMKMSTKGSTWFSSF